MRQTFSSGFFLVCLLSLVVSPPDVIAQDTAAAETAATETVTAVRDADGTWRIVGYFVH